MGKPSTSNKRIIAGILGILLGGLGIHKFYLGYNQAGLIMLLISILTFGLVAWVVQIIGIIEGILYLTKTDSEFDKIYVSGRKEWF